MYNELIPTMKGQAMQTLQAIDTPEGIEHFRICAVIGALRVEVKTGMKASRGVSALRVAQMYGCPKNTKKGALAWMESLDSSSHSSSFFLSQVMYFTS